MKFIPVIALLLMQALCFALGASVSPNLTAVFDPRTMAVKLKWQNNDARISSFILQRSADNNTWTDLYKIERNEFSKNKIEKYADLHPDPNKNYYRLRIISENNIESSPAIMVIMGQPTNSWLLYPVPVTTILHLQYTGSDPIPGVISVFIQNSQGNILTRLRNASLSRTIEVPVSNLGKGIYDIRIMVMDKIVWNQRFVK